MQGPLIRVVPEQRAEAQEAFRVETSWLAVADVSFADMLQIVDVAAKKSPTPSRLSKASSDGEAQILTIGHPEILHCFQGAAFMLLLEHTSGETVTSPQCCCCGCYRAAPLGRLLSAASFLMEITPPADRPCHTASGKDALSVSVDNRGERVGLKLLMHALLGEAP